MTRLPKGNGTISTSIREIDKRIKRLEPTQNPGMITNIDPTGVNQRPRNMLSGRSTSGSRSAPRYR